MSDTILLFLTTLTIPLGILFGAIPTAVFAAIGAWINWNDNHPFLGFSFLVLGLVFYFPTAICFIDACHSWLGVAGAA